jgi:hypothetical protein
MINSTSKNPNTGSVGAGKKDEYIRIPKWAIENNTAITLGNVEVRGQIWVLLIAPAKQPDGSLTLKIDFTPKAPPAAPNPAPVPVAPAAPAAPRARRQEDQSTVVD